MTNLPGPPINAPLMGPRGLVSSPWAQWFAQSLYQRVGGIEGLKAEDIPFTPYGALAATNVQAALQELDDEKLGITGTAYDSARLGGQLPAYYAVDSVVVHLAGTETITGAKSFHDAGFTIRNSADGTKTFVFSAGEITTGTMRTITVPDADFTLAQDALVVHLAGTETITGAKTFNASLSFADAVNFTFGTTTGTQIGTSATQKFAFFGATPIIKPSAITAATDLTTAYGTGGTALADVGTSFNQTTLNNNFKKVVDKTTNLETRVSDMYARFQNLGLLT